MAQKKLVFIVKAVDGFTHMFKRAKRGLRSFSRLAKATFRGIRKVGSLAFAGLAVAGVGLVSSLRQAFRFETWEAMFGRMFENLDRGKQEVKDLVMLAAKTPFTIPGIIDASRQVRIFTDMARGGIKDMIMLGDAAAYANADVKDVAFWFGRAYSALSSGRPMGRAALRLQELGVMGGKARNQLERMGDAGVSASTKIKALDNIFKRYSGTMENLEGTGDQLFANLQDMVTWSQATIGKEVSGVAKTAMVKFTKLLKSAEKSGALSHWGKTASKVLETTGKKVANLAWLLEAAFQSENMEVQVKARDKIGSGLFALAEGVGNSLISVMLKAAPIIGDAIGTAAKEAFDIFGDKAAESKIAYERLRQSGQITDEEHIKTWGGKLKWLMADDDKALLKQLKADLKSERLISDGMSLNAAYSGDLERGMKLLTEKFEGWDEVRDSKVHKPSSKPVNLLSHPYNKSSVPFDRPASDYSVGVRPINGMFSNGLAGSALASNKLDKPLPFKYSSSGALVVEEAVPQGVSSLS